MAEPKQPAGGGPTARPIEVAGKKIDIVNAEPGVVAGLSGGLGSRPIRPYESFGGGNLGGGAPGEPASAGGSTGGGTLTGEGLAGGALEDQGPTGGTVPGPTGDTGPATPAATSPGNTDTTGGKPASADQP